eukprot:7816-Heterococcus_DN1.PRE.8
MIALQLMRSGATTCHQQCLYVRHCCIATSDTHCASKVCSSSMGSALATEAHDYGLSRTVGRWYTLDTHDCLSASAVPVIGCSHLAPTCHIAAGSTEDTVVALLCGLMQAVDWSCSCTSQHNKLRVEGGFIPNSSISGWH